MEQWNIEEWQEKKVSYVPMSGPSPVHVRHTKIHDTLYLEFNELDLYYLEPRSYKIRIGLNRAKRESSGARYFSFGGPGGM
jgi:hypothetical protein